MKYIEENGIKKPEPEPFHINAELKDMDRTDIGLNILKIVDNRNKNPGFSELPSEYQKIEISVKFN